MISKTISTKKASATINYLIDEPVHNTKLTDHRNLDFAFHNVTLDGGNEVNAKWIMSQFSAVRSFAKNKNKTYQAEHIILSFSKSDFNCSSVESQSKQAIELVNGFFKEYFPEESQYFMVSQADNDGGLLHIHALINTVNIDGKVLDTNLTSQTRSGAFRDSVNNYLVNNFKSVTGRSYELITNTGRSKVANDHSSLSQMKKREAYSWKEDLQMRIALVMQRFKNFSGDDDEIEKALNESDIFINKKRRSIGKNKDGSKKYREAWTYSFVDKNGRERKIRDFSLQKNGKKTGLGEGFTPDSMRSHAKVYSERKEKLKKQKTLKQQSVVKHKKKSKEDYLEF